jgi:hypothetical protein
MAAAIMPAGLGADGRKANASPAETALESKAFSSPADAFAASSARSRNAGIRKIANAAVAINLALNLIVASPTARRDH